MLLAIVLVKLKRRQEGQENVNNVSSASANGLKIVPVGVEGGIAIVHVNR